MRDEAEKRIGHLYPPVEITPEMDITIFGRPRCFWRRASTIMKATRQHVPFRRCNEAGEDGQDPGRLGTRAASFPCVVAGSERGNRGSCSCRATILASPVDRGSLTAR